MAFTKDQTLEDGLLAQSDLYLWLWMGVLLFVPLLIEGPQLVVGSLVNSALILAAKTHPQQKWWLALAPSIAAVCRGLLLGNLTVFLIYFLPLIWLGNLALMELIVRTKYLPFGILIGGFLKTIFLITSARILISLNIIPTVF